METGRFNGHVFSVTPAAIRSFTGLTLSGSCETDVKESEGQQYVYRKAGKPVASSLTVVLNAMAGCDVRREAMALVEDARKGVMGYLYIGGKKLITSEMLLTEAVVEETAIAPGGAWIRCNVKLTLMQAKKNTDSASSGGTASSEKISVKQETESSTTVMPKHMSVKEYIDPSKVPKLKDDSLLAKAKAKCQEIITAGKEATGQHSAVIGLSPAVSSRFSAVNTR